MNAILDASNCFAATVEFRTEQNHIDSVLFERSKMMSALQHAYAHLELQVPFASQGSFIPPGEAFRGYAALVKVIQSAKSNLYLVEPYVTATLFTELAPMIPQGVSMRCLTSSQRAGELAVASRKWIATGENLKRPVEVRIAPPKSLHDRHIVVDGGKVWHISQSTKDIAKRSAASVSLDQTDLAAEKIAYLESLWPNGSGLPES